MAITVAKVYVAIVVLRTPEPPWPRLRQRHETEQASEEETAASLLSKPQTLMRSSQIVSSVEALSEQPIQTEIHHASSNISPFNMTDDFVWAVSPPCALASGPTSSSFSFICPSSPSYYFPNTCWNDASAAWNQWPGIRIFFLLFFFLIISHFVLDLSSLNSSN